MHLYLHPAPTPNNNFTVLEGLSNLHENILNDENPFTHSASWMSLLSENASYRIG
jgi:hypothetical protein